MMVVVLVVCNVVVFWIGVGVVVVFLVIMGVGGVVIGVFSVVYIDMIFSMLFVVWWGELLFI